MALLFQVHSRGGLNFFRPSSLPQQSRNSLLSSLFFPAVIPLSGLGCFFVYHAVIDSVHVTVWPCAPERRGTSVCYLLTVSFLIPILHRSCRWRLGFSAYSRCFRGSRRRRRRRCWWRRIDACRYVAVCVWEWQGKGMEVETREMPWKCINV